MDAPTIAAAENISITAAYPRFLMALVEERGGDAERVLALAGLDSAYLQREDARVSALQYAAMVLASMDACGDQGLGYALAMRTPPTAHGPLGFAMMCSPTLGDALALGLKYMNLLQNGAALTFWQDGAWVCLRADLALTGAPLPVYRYFTEALMAGIARLAAWLLGTERVGAGELWFDYAEPAYFAGYAGRLPPVRYDAPHVQLRIPAELLRHKLPLADEVACQRALAQCERESALLASGAVNLAARVRESLHARTGRYPNAEEMAGRLHLSVRTFKRRLAEQGTSFRALLEEVQRIDAIELLSRRHVPLARIAEELGYADPANFTRAFKRWTGMTPSAFLAADVQARDLVRD
jgi:AraC-like DNA-binding protein